MNKPIKELCILSDIKLYRFWLFINLFPSSCINSLLFDNFNNYFLLIPGSISDELLNQSSIIVCIGLGNSLSTSNIGKSLSVGKDLFK
jgi:hypothetical protein